MDVNNSVSVRRQRLWVRNLLILAVVGGLLWLTIGQPVQGDTPGDTAAQSPSLDAGAVDSEGHATIYHQWLPVAPSDASGRKPLRGVAALKYNTVWWSDYLLLKPDWYFGYWYQIDDGSTPMLKVSTYADGVAYMQERRYKGYVMFLDEPEILWQDNISPVAAADLYADLTTRLPRAKIIAPNIWWNGPSNGVQWLRDWHDEIVRRGLPLPYGYAVHYHVLYGPNRPWTAVDEAWTLIQSWGENSAELWLTEFIVCDNPTDLRTILWRLDTTPYLTRYSFFASRHNDGEWEQCRYELIDNAGALTPNGLVYARP